MTVIPWGTCRTIKMLFTLSKYTNIKLNVKNIPKSHITIWVGSHQQHMLENFSHLQLIQNGHNIIFMEIQPSILRIFILHIKNQTTHVNFKKNSNLLKCRVRYLIIKTPSTQMFCFTNYKTFTSSPSESTIIQLLDWFPPSTAKHFPIKATKSSLPLKSKGLLFYFFALIFVKQS